MTLLICVIVVVRRAVCHIVTATLEYSCMCGWLISHRLTPEDEGAGLHADSAFSSRIIDCGRNFFTDLIHFSRVVAAQTHTLERMSKTRDLTSCRQLSGPRRRGGPLDSCRDRFRSLFSKWTSCRLDDLKGKAIDFSGGFLLAPFTLKCDGEICCNAR